jgi:hypothetical protein
MKAILEFDLNELDDKLAHKRAVSSTDAYLVILGLQGYLRSRLKYEEIPEEAVEALDLVRTKLYELLSEYNVDMDDLL